jgi:adenylate cyclase
VALTVLDADKADAVPGVPVIARHPVVLDGIWRVSGGVAPLPPLVDATRGLGALSLPGDADGKIRRVPLLVGAGDATRPGLALEAVRLAKGSPAYFVDVRPQRIIVGDLEMPLPSDGLLRLAGADARKHESRTISAVDVVNGDAVPRWRGNRVRTIARASSAIAARLDADPLTSRSRFRRMQSSRFSPPGHTPSRSGGVRSSP